MSSQSTPTWRALGLRWRVLLLGALTAMVLLGITWQAWLRVSQLPVFQISGLRISGNLPQYDAASLQSQMSDQWGDAWSGSIFELDLQQTKEHLESLPWVRSAKVARELPSTVRIELQAHQVAAWWSSSLQTEAPGATGSMLVNEQGEVFEAEIDESKRRGLVHLVGDEAAVKDLLPMAQSLQRLLQKHGQSLLALEQNGQSSLRAHVPGAILELGTGGVRAVELRTLAFLQSVPSVMKNMDASIQGNGPYANLRYADLRYASGYALRMAGVTTYAKKGKG